MASTMSTSPSPNVGTAGGVLGSADGDFMMTIPPGVLAPGYNLGILESGGAPSGAPALPASTEAVSQYFDLIGYAMSGQQVATIAFSPTWVGNVPADRLSVYSWAGGAAWQFQPTAVLATSGEVQVDVSGPDTLVVLINRTAFSDVPSGYWATGAIDQVVATGVMNGVGGGLFAPDQIVTRAQFAKLLALSLGLPPSAAPATYTDVAAGAWYAPYVASVAQAGLMTGVTATTFAPDQPVTREEMAVLITRAMKLQPTGGLGYSDATKVDSWATSGVVAASSSGYMTGYPDGTFQPLATVTRAQAAAVAARLIVHQAP